MQAGDRAPDFTLDDQHGAPVTLSGLRGAPVLLVFYPLAFSGVCSGELRALADAVPALGDVRILTVSVDSIFALRAWSDREDFPFSLLSDFWPHGATAQAYDAFDANRGVARRATFLIDAEGIVRRRVETPISEPRDVNAYREALAAL
ncbi:peroxiredoxin [Actinomadura flavalba]|uniref:peroxiredoxin n=1 Tax=Actinomadura flavalba TaxID=1120938 RepID=UPI00037C0CDC